MIRCTLDGASWNLACWTLMQTWSGWWSPEDGWDRRFPRYREWNGFLPPQCLDSWRLWSLVLCKTECAVWAIGAVPVPLKPLWTWSAALSRRIAAVSPSEAGFFPMSSRFPRWQLQGTQLVPALTSHSIKGNGLDRGFRRRSCTEANPSHRHRRSELVIQLPLGLRWSFANRLQSPRRGRAHSRRQPVSR